MVVGTLPAPHTLTATTYIPDANMHQPAFCFLLPSCHWWLPIALYNHTNTCVPTWHAEHTPQLRSIDDISFR